jgi:hypothetical protein
MLLSCMGSCISMKHKKELVSFVVGKDMNSEAA